MCEERESLTLDFDGWRVAACLHYATEENGNVSGMGLVVVVIQTHTFIQISILDIAVLENRGVLQSRVRQVMDWKMILLCESKLAALSNITWAVCATGTSAYKQPVDFQVKGCKSCIGL